MARDLNQTIFVAGHRGMAGSAIVRRLRALGYDNILTAGRDELNLLDQQAVHAWFQSHAIDQVYLAAARSVAYTPTIPSRLISSTKI